MESTSAESRRISPESASGSTAASRLVEEKDIGRNDGVQMNAVLKSIPLGLIVADSEDQVALVNDAALALLDADRSDVIGRPLEQIAACMQPIQDTALSDRLAGLELRDTESICEISGQLVLVSETAFEDNETGEPGKALMLRDITLLIVDSNLKLDSLLEQLTKLEGEVDHLRKVDHLKSRFIADMSHDLRNPLNSIIGFSSVILKGIDGPITDLQREDLTKINSSGKHLLSLVNDILDITHLWSGKAELRFSPVKLAELIEVAVEDAAPLIGDKDLTLETAIASDLPVIHADKTRMEQVLSHLLRNAIKYTESGQVTITALVEEGEVIISVADTGIGISSEHLDHIFEEFYRVDEPVAVRLQGLGLGLSISRRLVEMHGGKVWAESELGVGSTFYLGIPVDARVKSLT